jgi:thiol-disulfide isomerase/thioredoxin
VLVLIAVLVATTLVGLLWRSQQGRVRPATGDVDLLAELGEQPGERATLLQFSSAFCAPCRATRRVLGDIAAVTPGVRHVEVDAEQHLGLVRRLNVLKTPTTLVLDANQSITDRAAGLPRKEHVLAALDRAVR